MPGRRTRAWFYLVITGFMASLATAVMVHILRGGYSPGADDNASGTAVLLEVAERLKGKEPALGIDICLLAAEERGSSAAAIGSPGTPRSSIG